MEVRAGRACLQAEEALAAEAPAGAAEEVGVAAEAEEEAEAGGRNQKAFFMLRSG